MTSTPLQKRYLRLSNTRHPPLSVSSPAKGTKMTVPSPLALRPSPTSCVPTEPLPEAPGPRESLEDGPSVFDILNVFRCWWFLNRDHLLANILSAQKDDTGNIFWVDFLPHFHMHLVQQAIALLPPLCPVTKGKKVMFLFILEVLDGDGCGTFLALPKKQESRHCRCSGKRS